MWRRRLAYTGAACTWQWVVGSVADRIRKEQCCPRSRPEEENHYPVAGQLPCRQHHGYPCSRPTGVCTNMTCCCVDHNKTEAMQRQDSDVSSSPPGPYTPLSSWPCPCWRSATPPKRKCPLGRPGNRPPLGSRMVTELPTHRRSSIR